MPNKKYDIEPTPKMTELEKLLAEPKIRFGNTYDNIRLLKELYTEDLEIADNIE